MKIPIQDKNRMRVQTTVLRFLYAGGVCAVGMAAPPLLRLFPPADRSRARRKQLYQRIGNARYRLAQRGLLEVKNGRLHLTKAGERSIERILLREYEIPPPVQWDGKWRILSFDISERRRSTRERLRSLLSSAGFVRLQDSLWVHPYPCDEFVALIRAHLASGIGEVRSFVTEALESDRALREHFDLM